MKVKYEQCGFDENAKPAMCKCEAVVHFKRNGNETLAHFYSMDGEKMKMPSPSWWKAYYFSTEGHGECEWDFITKLPSATDEQARPLIALMKSCGYQF